MADIEVTLGADAKEFKGALTEIQKDVGKMASGTMAELAKMGQAFMGLKDMVQTAFAGVSGMITGVFDLARPAMAVQNMKAELKGLTGSAVEAQRALDEIDKWAVKSRYSLEDMYKGATALMKGGISSTLAPDLLKKLATIAGGDQGKLDGLIAAMVKGSGGIKGFSSEVLEAFSGAQVDLLGALEKTTGLKGQGLTDKLNAGVNFDTLMGAINELAREGGALSNAEKEAEAGVEGLLNSIGNHWTVLMQEFGGGLLGPLAELLEGAEGTLSGWGTSAAELGTAAGEALTTAAGMAWQMGGAMVGLVDNIDHVIMALVGLKAATMAYGLQMKTAASQSAASLRFIRISIATTSGAFGKLWAGIKSGAAMASVSVKAMAAGMAVAVRTAVVAIKSALISTGIGALVWGAGEAIAAIYSALAGGEEDLSDAEAARAERARARKEQEEAKGRARESHIWAENELKQFRDGLAKATTQSEVLGQEERLKGAIKELQQRIKDEEKMYGWTVAGEAMKKDVARLQAAGMSFLNQKEAVLSHVRLKEEEEKKRQEFVKMLEEATKREKKAREDLVRLDADRKKANEDRIYKDLDMEAKREAMRKRWQAIAPDSDAFDMGGLEKEMARARKHRNGEIAVKRFKELSTLEKDTYAFMKEDEKWQAEKMKSGREYALAKAELEGNRKEAQKIQVQLDYADAVKGYKDRGYSEQEAAKLARRDVKLDLMAEKSKESPLATLGDIIKQSGVEVGNGGRSLGISSSQLGEAKKSNEYLKKLSEAVDKIMLKAVPTMGA